MSRGRRRRWCGAAGDDGEAGGGGGAGWVEEQGVVWMPEEGWCRGGACPSLLNYLIAQAGSGVHLSSPSSYLLRAVTA